MSDLPRIRSNYNPRPIIDPVELSESERAEFDYLDWPAIDAGTDSASFVRYLGTLYSLDQFERVEVGGDLAKAGWSGFHADSAFTGVLIRLSDDGETAVMGRYLS